MSAQTKFRRFVSVIAWGLLLPVIAHATIGESFAALKERLGSATPTARKNVRVWFIEAIDGQLTYTVTFNAADKSIAEGIKPVKRARFTPDLAQDFIATQTRPYAGSKTLREIAPGEKYTFANRNFTCGENETAIVDDANGLLIVWIKAPLPSIMAISHEMFSPPPTAK
ncbi:hypothetical protein [Oleiharenicola lentus]|uniref:hypothetical protein n=1 Tax=Oleiharenicola lentus TaxID=2508720 RepID=UPI003F6663F1